MNIREIAKRAGVSTATVSNVLNGKLSKVSDETKEKIESIIKATGYKPALLLDQRPRHNIRLIACCLNNALYLLFGFIRNLGQFAV